MCFHRSGGFERGVYMEHPRFGMSTDRVGRECCEISHEEREIGSKAKMRTSWAQPGREYQRNVGKGQSRS